MLHELGSHQRAKRARCEFAHEKCAQKLPPSFECTTTWMQLAARTKEKYRRMDGIFLWLFNEALASQDPARYFLLKALILCFGNLNISDTETLA